MADNVSTGAGDATIPTATDDIGGFHHQRVKLSVGADGSASDAIPVSAGLNTTAAGVPAVGLVAQLDDVSPSSVTENQFAPVRLSPRRALLVEGVASPDTTLQNAVSASGNGSNLSVTGYAAAIFVITGTFTASVFFEGSMDGGTTWSSLTAHNSTGASIGVSASSVGHYKVNCAGYDLVRCPVVWGSGTSVTVVGRGINAFNPLQTVYLGTGTSKIGGVDLDSDALPGSAVPSFAQYMAGTDGTNARGLKTDASGELQVDVLTAPNTAAAGTVAHDGSTANNPVTTGGRAIAHGTNPTAVAAADVTDSYHNRAGVQFTIGGHPNVQTFRTQFTAAQTNVALVTVSGGLKIVLTSFQVTLDNASTVFPSVLMGFGASTTPTGAGVVGAHGGVPAGGGFGKGDGSGILGVGADGEDLRITTVGAATGNGVEVTGSYFTIES